MHSKPSREVPAARGSNFVHSTDYRSALGKGLIIGVAKVQPERESTPSESIPWYDFTFLQIKKIMNFAGNCLKTCALFFVVKNAVNCRNLASTLRQDCVATISPTNFNKNDTKNGVDRVGMSF